MKFLLLIVIICHSKVTCENGLVGCARKILEYFKAIPTILAYKTGGDIVDLILNGVDWDLQVHNLELPASKDEYQSVRFTLVVLDEVGAFGDYLVELNRSLVTNNAMSYAVVHLGHNNLPLLSERVANLNVARLLAVNRMGRVYMSNFLRPSQPKYLCNCSELGEQHLNEGFGAIPNFLGSKVRVIYQRKPPYVLNETHGIEIAALRETEKRYNFTLDFNNVEFLASGFKMRSGEFTEMYKHIYQNQSDLMVGLIEANQTFLKEFDPTSPYIACTHSIFVPTAKKHKAWRGILIVYTSGMWLCIAGSLLFINTTMLAFAKRLAKRKKFCSVSFCTLLIFSILLKMAVPQPKMLHFRIIFLSWVLYSLIISSSFESKLLTYILAPSYEHQVDNKDEIVDVGFIPMGNVMTRDLFSNQGTPLQRYLYENWMYCIAPCFNSTMLKDKNFAVVVDNNLIHSQIRRDLSEDERREIHEIPKLMFYYTWIVLRRNFPFHRPLNDVFQGLNNGGFLRKWLSEQHYVKPTDQVVRIKKLSLDSLLVPFWVYLGGVIGASALFVWEIL